MKVLLDAPKIDNIGWKGDNKWLTGKSYEPSEDPLGSDQSLWDTISHGGFDLSITHSLFWTEGAPRMKYANS